MPVTICGFDMTSAPTRRKPVTMAECHLLGDVLELTVLRPLASVAGFRAVLDGASPAGEPWVAGLDMPFGQPFAFLREAGWPEDWAEYVRHAASLSREAFAESIYAVMAGRPRGDKLIRRITDVVAGAISPMSLAYVPVGRMFHVLSPVIEASGACVVPVRMQGDPRVLLEAYPALVARAIVGRLPYKDGPKEQRGLRAQHRASLLEGLAAHVQERSGLRLEIPGALHQQMLEDPCGDYLDALLCAVQAAHVFLLPGWGMPDMSLHEEGDAHWRAWEIMTRTEGWIVETGLPGDLIAAGLATYS